jgi:hypothetical protein
MSIEPVERWVDILRRTILALVRRDGPDLTARQLSTAIRNYGDVFGNLGLCREARHGMSLVRST